MDRTAGTTQATAAELRDQLAAVEAEIDQLAARYGAAVADGNPVEAAASEARVDALDTRARELKAAIEAAERAEALASARRAQLEQAAAAEAERRARAGRQRQRLTTIAERLEAHAGVVEAHAEWTRLSAEAEAVLPLMVLVDEWTPAARREGFDTRAFTDAASAMIEPTTPAAVRAMAARYRAEAEATV